MKIILILISILGLVLTVVPSFFVMIQLMTWTLHTQLVFIGMILWFATSPFWIKTD